MDFSLRRVCAVLAHPDDEVFIAGALRRHLEEGARVTGLWITSGDARGGRERREAELSRSLTILGLSPENVGLARLPNQGLLPRVAQTANWLAEKLAACAPQLLYVTAYEGGHIEHDIVNCVTRAAWQAVCPQAVCLEFPLYNRTGPWLTRGWRVNAFPPGRGDVAHVPLERDHLRRKFAMMRAYRSQWMDMLPFRLAMPGWRYARQGEPCAPLPPERDYSISPHPGRLNYERNPGRHCFADFASAVAALRLPIT